MDYEKLQSLVNEHQALDKNHKRLISDMEHQALEVKLNKGSAKSVTITGEAAIHAKQAIIVSIEKSKKELEVQIRAVTTQWLF